MELSRRRLLVGGGIGAGLIVAWSVWPRAYPATLVAGPGEHAFGAWLKIGGDGRVTVAVPQAETGQGIWTGLAQIVADELGSDWRTVGVEPAPLNPLYANPLGLEELLEGMPAALPAEWRDGGANPAPMLTAASSGIRMFEGPAREAAAAARALLCMAAAARWDADWADCRAEAGFVVLGDRRLRFAELAGEAAGFDPPDPPPVGLGGAGKLMGAELARIDASAKVDGSANFAADIRLPDMVHAAIGMGPPGETRLTRIDRDAARRIRGSIEVIETERWVAAIAATSWAARQMLDALAPRFETRGQVVDTGTVDRALVAAFEAAFEAGGQRVAAGGDLSAAFAGARLFTAEYRARPGVRAAIETPAAVARYDGERLELWLPTQAPGIARTAVARAADVGEDRTIVHLLPVGGGFGAALDSAAAEQAALLAVRLRRPVSVQWSRRQTLVHDPVRPPAIGRLAARLGTGGALLGWQTRIASPATGRALAKAMRPGIAAAAALRADPADAYAVGGATPPYRMEAFAIDHHAAEIALPTGHLRGGMHGVTCFFTESFIDELAHVALAEPLSYRIGLLGGEPRLARCLSTVAALGGWEGGTPGSGQGIAAHAFRGSFAAVMAEARMESGRPRVERLVAAVDCGRIVNPDLVRQQIEGGLVFGLAHALGATTGHARGLATATSFADLWLPRLADTPDITVELIRSGEAPGGVAEIAIPPVAPAIANALWAATGYRTRSLPLV